MGDPADPRRRRSLRLAAAALLFAAAALPSCRRRPPPPSILLLTIDTVRADRLGCYGHAAEPGGSPSPLADRLAAEGTLFLHCYAPRGQTHPSLASLLTGLYPAAHGLRENGQDLDPTAPSLAAALARAGYRTAAFCSNLDRTRWPFWVRGFEVARDGVDGRLLEEGGKRQASTQRTWDERVVRGALRFLEERRREENGRPFFLWVHLFDPHAPYTPDPDDARRFLPEDAAGPVLEAYRATFAEEPARDRLGPLLAQAALGRRPLDERDRRTVRALYDASIWGCERRLERVLEEAERAAGAGGLLVIYTSDHGEELGEVADYFGHGASLREPALRVPLLVRWKGRIPARRIEEPVRSFDVFATILEAAGVEPPEDTESRSLWPLIDGSGAGGEVTDVPIAEWRDLALSALDGRFQWIENPLGARPRKPPYHLDPAASYPLPCFALYDLSADPRERRDVARDHPAAVRRLRAAVSAFRRDPRHARPFAASAGPDPGLEALGYLGRPGRDDVVFVPCGGREDER